MKDHHVHSTFSDGKASIDEMVSAAKRLGYAEVAFAEHFNPFLAEFNRQTGFKMHIYPEEISSYFQACEQAEQRHQTKVLKGFEVSWLTPQKDIIMEALEKYAPSLDVILISVHHLELLDDFIRPNGTVEKKGYSIYVGGAALKAMIEQYGGIGSVMAAYAERIESAISHLKGLCPKTIVAHLIHFSFDPLYDEQAAKPIVRPLLRHIRDNGLCLEVNFAYYQRNGCTEPRPYFDEVTQFLRLGGSISFGSDAHTVEDLNNAARHYPVFERLRRDDTSKNG